MLTEMPKALSDFYDSVNAAEAKNKDEQLQILRGEKVLFAEIRLLLDKLSAVESLVESRELPTDQARDLLRRKAVMRYFAEAWSQWHDDNGNPFEACRALEEFLCHKDASTVVNPDDANSYTLAYTAHLLTALAQLDREGRFECFVEHPLPAWIEDSLLLRYFEDFKTLQSVKRNMAESKWWRASDGVEELTNHNDTAAYAKPLAYELWVNVRDALERTVDKEQGHLVETLEVLDPWLKLWHDQDPLAAARRFEEQGLKRRAAQIRWSAGRLAFENWNWNKERAALRILELFTDDERLAAGQPILQAISLQQLWNYLRRKPTDREVRVVLEIDSADETAIESWLQSQDPYGNLGPCPKAVLATSLTHSAKQSLEFTTSSLDQVLVYLKGELSSVLACSAKVEPFRRTYLRSVAADEVPSDWIWLSWRDGRLGALSFAVELTHSKLDGSISWMLHTLVELDRANPRIGYQKFRVGLRHASSNTRDYNKQKSEVVAAVDNFLHEHEIARNR